jgi:imidazolonepropionase
VSPPATDLLVRGIGRLVPMRGEVVPAAAVLVRAGRVAWTGPEARLPAGIPDLPELDAAGGAVLPGFVDCHTHLVWAGTRREEFVARLAGQPYTGGGIAVTAAATRAATTEELVRLTAARVAAAARTGTTTIEVKSGYGLSTVDELRCLDVIGTVAASQPVRLLATYLGAHAVPADTDADAYLAEVVGTLPAARQHGAIWCDVFCDRGAFSVEQAGTILRSARDAGLRLRLHAEQLAATGAARLAAELAVDSADHLDHVSADDARALAAAGVVGVVLPTVTLSTRSDRWDVARRLRDAGVTVALATDCNPGTSWCESMPYAVQLACLGMGMSVGDAFRAATLGGGAALRLTDAGHLEVGACGDLVVLAAEHEADLVAHLGADPVAVTVVGGSVV